MRIYKDTLLCQIAQMPKRQSHSLREIAQRNVSRSLFGKCVAVHNRHRRRHERLSPESTSPHPRKSGNTGVSIAARGPLAVGLQCRIFGGRQHTAPINMMCRAHRELPEICVPTLPNGSQALGTVVTNPWREACAASLSPHQSSRSPTHCKLNGSC